MQVPPCPLVASWLVEGKQSLSPLREAFVLFITCTVLGNNALDVFLNLTSVQWPLLGFRCGLMRAAAEFAWQLCALVVFIGEGVG